ncbi:MAG TPA: inosine/xanthosine triphosphatase [Candidatus Paceibacterota bacterium]
MKVVIGTQNRAKVAAVEEILRDYPHLAAAEIDARAVASDVSDQPLSLEETVRGACNRAKNAFGDCDYAIGMEGGFMQVPNSKSGYMNVSACAVFDGENMHVGLSPAFETPDAEVMRLVVEDGLNFTEAGNRTGMTNDAEIGKHGGLIGLLTKGKIDRKEYVKQSLHMALIHIDQA